MFNNTMVNYREIVPANEWIGVWMVLLGHRITMEDQGIVVEEWRYSINTDWEMEHGVVELLVETVVRRKATFWHGSATHQFIY